MLERDALARLGIDVEEGIACCAGDPEFFDEMVVAYLDESAERLTELARLYESRDWPQYTRCAHSIKSTSMMIGARSLSELARTMELAGKEGRSCDSCRTRALLGAMHRLRGESARRC